MSGLAPDLASIPAGRELDLAVAIEVMGYRDEPEFGLMDGERFVEADSSFTPSTDIGDAWLVVAKLQNYRNERAPAIWWNITAGCFACIPGFDMTLARIMHDWPEDMPLAICRAALMAVRS